MTTTKITKGAGVCLAAISMAALLADATVASAQPDQGYNQGGYNQNQGGDQYGPPPGGDDNYGPPQGQYAQPPPGYENGGDYDNGAQRSDYDYAQRYSGWAAQYCVDRRNNNTAAGAVIGGVFGALLGAGVAGGRNAGAGALVGGALGAGTGAAIGSSSGAGGGCPPGYVIRGGAPAFYWAGPQAAYWAPAWYHPWVFAGGRWTYRPYRTWYWAHRGSWRPGWRGHPWRPGGRPYRP